METDDLISLLSGIEIERTEDGSPTLFVPGLEERYHSNRGARTESEWVFVRQGLRTWLQRSGGACTLLEAGFGTGLNALLSLLETMGGGGRELLYHAYEINPLPLPLIREMWQGTLPGEEMTLMEQIHSAEWDVPVRISASFVLHKHREDLLTAKLPRADVLYMDAFAPEKTPELWSENFLRKLYEAALPGARLSTYCAKGVIRRRLRDLGFRVYRTPGPPGGKREILTADKD